MTNYLFQRILDRIGTASNRGFLESPDGPQFTYADMIAASGRAAAALCAFGVAPGDRVAAQIEKSFDGLMLYLGAIRAGAIFLPLNTAYTTTELGYFFEDAQPKIIICDPAQREGLAAVARNAGVSQLDTLGSDGRGSFADKCAELPSGFNDAARGQSDLAALLYTSGTTGRSKGAMLTHGNLASNAETLVNAWRLTASDVLLHALPTYHTHGLFVAINTLLFCGGSIILLPKFDADECIRQFPRATVMMGGPTYYARLLRHDALSHEATEHMRLFISGSAPLLE